MAELHKKRSYDESSREQTLEDEESNNVSFVDSKTDAHQPAGSRPDDEDDGGDWQLVEGRSRKKARQNANSKLPTPDKNRAERRRENRDWDRSRREDQQRQHQAQLVERQNGSQSTKPAVSCAPAHRLNSSLKIGDLQQLVLYCLADGVSPSWLSVRSHFAIRRAVVLMVPGLEKTMFTGEIKLGTAEASTGADGHVSSAADDIQNDGVAKNVRPSDTRSPDQYLPTKLESLELPECLRPFGNVFEQLFPITAPGDDKGNRVHSPVAAILTTPIPKSADEKRQKGSGPRPPRVANDWKDTPAPVTSFITSPEDLLESDYVLHPVSCSSSVDRETNEQRRKHTNATPENGWKEAKISGDETIPTYDLSRNELHAGRRVLAIDCEMVKAEGQTPTSDLEYVLARISIRDWNHNTILDELVKPSRPVIDYVTAFSGMTAEKLAPVTTSLEDIQQKLLKLFTPDTILVGHSLDSDLRAFKVTHPYIIDTSIIYPHPRGPPMKSSLKFLAQKYLGREIQRHTGNAGHDSIEDADACLDLVKEKCKHGKGWGTSEASGESIFKRLARTPKPGVSVPAGSTLDLRDCRMGAVVDHGRPERTIGAAAKVTIPCNTDADVVAGIKRCVNGDPDGAVVPGGGVDFTFARMRELEAKRGWASDSAPNLQGPGGTDKTLTREELTESVAQLSARIKEIHDSLPKCTLFIVYSGVGDPREMKRLTDMQRQFRKEYAVKKWDEISVKWTDTEEQALKAAVREARAGCGFVTVT